MHLPCQKIPRIPSRNPTTCVHSISTFDEDDRTIRCRLLNPSASPGEQAEVRSVWRAALLSLGLLALMVVSSTPLSAQENGRITGTVTESSSGGPVSDAQVYLPDDAIGTLSRANGRYLIINVPTGTYTIRAERIGLGSAEQQVTITAGGIATVDFVLEELALGLDEIVVTGTAGAARRREIGNSIAQINVAELPDRPVDMIDLLQGAAPGLDMSATGGELGVAPAIRLRGNSSVSMSNNPIIYIDGVRMRSEPLAHVAAPDHRGIRGSNTSKSPLNSINPNDIERIEIMKGSAATTLYGTEASAGVIQIFTKRRVRRSAAVDHREPTGRGMEPEVWHSRVPVPPFRAVQQDWTQPVLQHLRPGWARESPVLRVGLIQRPGRIPAQRVLQ